MTRWSETESGGLVEVVEDKVVDHKGLVNNDSRRSGGIVEEKWRRRM